MNSEKTICINFNDNEKIAEALEKGYDVILGYDSMPGHYCILRNELARRIDDVINSLYKIIESNNAALSNPDDTIIGKKELLNMSNKNCYDLIRRLKDE